MDFLWIYFSEIKARTLTIYDQPADVTYCADVMLFLHAMSGILSLTAAFILRRFLAFYCFQHFLGKNIVFTQYYTF